MFRVQFYKIDNDTTDILIDAELAVADNIGDNEDKFIQQVLTMVFAVNNHPGVLSTHINDCIIRAVPQLRVAGFTIEFDAYTYVILLKEYIKWL